MCDGEQTTNVKSSRLSLGFDAHCMHAACALQCSLATEIGPGPDCVSASQRWKLRQPTTGKPGNEEVHSMLYTIAVVLLVLWLLGLVSSVTMGGFIHILLVAAIIMVLFSVISGRRSA
jgi:hypothetical protein